MMNLSEAIWQRNFKRVKELVESGVDVNIPAFDWMSPPLLEAIRNDDMRMVAYLLAHGAKPTATILEMCIREECKPNIFKRLLKTGINPNLWEEKERIPLLVNAARFGKYRLASRLLEAGADPNIPEFYFCGDKHKSPGATPLMMAAYYNHIRLLDKLLTYGANINSLDADGKNALFYACIGFGELKIYRWLVTHGINIQVRTTYGYSILDCINDVYPFVAVGAEKYLIACGAPPATKVFKKPQTD